MIDVFLDLLGFCDVKNHIPPHCGACTDMRNCIKLVAKANFWISSVACMHLYTRQPDFKVKESRWTHFWCMHHNAGE